MLEIGSGSGFLTACLAKLAGNVVSIDIHAELASMAETNLADAGIENVTVHCMDAMSKLPAGKFDLIAVTGSVPEFQSRFLQALKPQGRMFCVVGEAPVMEALLVTRGEDAERETVSLFETLVPRLERIERTPRFEF